MYLLKSDYFIDRWIARGLLIGLLILFATTIQSKPQFNQSLNVYYDQTIEANYYFGEDRSDHYDLLRKDLVFGIRKIQNFYSKNGLPEKPSFWFFSNKKDMSRVLEKKCNFSNHKIFHGNVFRSSCGVFILYTEGADQVEIQRLIFQEYSFLMLKQLMTNDKIKYTGWFQTALPVYMSWQVAGEISGESLMETHAQALDHFSSYFDPDKAVPLDDLENKKDWEYAFKKSPSQTLGQSVIAYLYWTTKSRYNSGIDLLKRIQKSDEFQGEFERLSGMRLHEFEKELQKKVYPEVKLWRKNNPERIRREKDWPIATNFFELSIINRKF